MISKIFSEAAQQGIYLYLKEGRLAYKATGDDISEDFKKIIVEHKAEIVEFLELQNMDVVIAKHPLKPFDRALAPLPLSYAQQRLWLLDKIDGGGAQYNMPGALKLTGKLRVEVLTQAFTSILERHESLRTYFMVGDDGEPLQVIQATIPLNVFVIDLSALEEGARQLRLAECVAEEFGYVFDLSSDLMLRAQLIKVADDENIVLVNMHHIASDGWSMGILINEFSTLYSAYVQGQENPLPPLPIQYADYAYWQRNWLQGEILDQQLDYWTTQLASLPVVHGVVLDHARPPVQTFVGNTISSHINAEVNNNLTALCEAQSATLFMGLHAAFSVLLSRYSNETDIVVGSPIANREQVEIAGLIGFFVNTLVLRSDLSESPSFVELLKQSKKMLLDAYAHQQVPFEQIVERLQPERILSHSALFQIMLVLQNNDQGVLKLPGLTLSPVAQRGAGIAKYDLTLNVTESEEGLWLDWEYNTDLFEQETIARMANHFEILLKALVTTPNENVFNVEMLSAQERNQLLIDLNNTQTNYPKEKCIHELFESQVENNPNAIAVVFEEQRLTYCELNQKANQLAHYLLNEKQVTPDTLIGICIERSFEMVIGILAILKAGGAYVPLDPEYPEARLKYMLDDAKLTTVLTQHYLRASTPVTDAQAVCLDDENLQQQLQAQSIENPKLQDLSSNHLAYVIYTSGSTGNPKGVLIERRGFRNLINWYVKEYAFCIEDKALILSSMGFDLTQKNIFSPLVSGGQVALLRPGIYDPAEIIKTIKKHSVSVINCAPSSLYGVVEYSVDNNYQDLGSLRYVLLGGEPINSTLLNPWLNHTECHASLVNMYGPTECTDIVTASFQKDKVQGECIGCVIANTSVYVLNENCQLSHFGGVGQLCVSGVGLARGYLNNPDLTAEKFIVNPFYDKNNSSTSERLYKTGDLVRWLPDGNLEFLGRVDHQIKIRGFRIEPGEIESVLNAHSAVKDSIVLAKESSTGARLVAYVVTDAIEPIDDNEPRHKLIENLRHCLKQILPDYMVPAAFVLLEQLPLTPNGKVDRKALPEPDMSAQQNIYVAPRTETEKILCEIWQEILGVERAGVTDNFFSLGGGSLSAVRMVAQASQKTNTVINLGGLFNSQTIELLAIKIEQSEMISSVTLDGSQELASDEMELKI